MKPPKSPALYTTCEYKLERLRECSLPRRLRLCDNPRKMADYWRTVVVNHPAFNAEAECCVVVLLNARRRAIGHYLVAIGTLDTLLVHPREVFRIAVAAGTSAVVLMHNHPTGDATPSESDIRATKDMLRAGMLLRIDLLDHVIIGAGRRYVSLRQLGYFTMWQNPEPKPAAKPVVIEMSNDARLLALN